MLKADSIKANASIKNIESSEINYKDGSPANNNFSLSKDGRLNARMRRSRGKLLAQKSAACIMHGAT